LDGKNIELMWDQKQILLPPFSRGFHLITDEILNQCLEIQNINIGLLHIFIKHTSASLTLNEDADPTVRQDFESHFNKMIPENAPYYRHTFEGSDDMPAHLKEDFVANVKDLFKKHAYTEKNFPRTYRSDMNITATIIDVLKYDKLYCGYKLGRKQPDLLDSIIPVLVGLIIYFVIFR